MNRVGEEIATIATAIIGVAILAVIVSKQANTAGVITSAGTAFSGALQVAVSPLQMGGGYSGAGIGYNG